MHNRQRNILIRFFVTPEEKKMIRKRMIISKTSNMSAFLRKMAIDGIIANVDTTYLKMQFEEMHRIGINVNQIAKIANTTGTATQEDIAEVKGMLNELWKILKKTGTQYLDLQKGM